MQRRHVNTGNMSHRADAELRAVALWGGGGDLSEAAGPFVPELVPSFAAITRQISRFRRPDLCEIYPHPLSLCSPRIKY